MRRAALLLLTLTAAPAAAQGLAVDARPAEGPPASGELTLGPKGAFRFRGTTKPLAPEDVTAFRPTGQRPASFRSPFPVRVRLLQRQVITGEIVGVDRGRITLRTSWADSVSIPRGAAESVAHPDGWQLVFADTFEADSADWKEAGRPRRAEGDATSGKRALVLDAPAQRAALKLKEPLAGGKVGVNFRQLAKATGRRWVVELELAGDKGAAPVVSVELGDTLTVRSAGKPEHRGEARRSHEWRRLTVEFSESWLRVVVDDLVLWSQAQGPGGRLRAGRLACDGDASGAGEMLFDDFAVHAAVAPKRLTPHDPTQDAVATRDGDTLFGRASNIDAGGITVEGKFGKRKVCWTEAAVVTFVRQGIPLATTDGEHARLTLRGPDGLRDLLDGVIKAIDPKRIVLTHALLGELTIPAGAVEEIRPRFFGRELLIDAGPHHLGKKTRAEFAAPKPEGLSLTRRFRVDQLNGDATLVVEAAHLVGPADRKDVAESLKRGGMRTAVYINEQRAGSLNDLVDRAVREPSAVRLTVPKDLLTVGANTVELRQTADPETGRVADVEVHSLRLELPRAR